MTPTEERTGLTAEIRNGLGRGLEEFQKMVDNAVNEGADQHFLYHSEDSPIRDIRAAQAWLARMSHQIHLEHVAMEEKAE